MNVPGKLFYTKDHEWVKITEKTAIIGITDYAQRELGDIIFIEFPIEGSRCILGDSIGTIEAVKTVADIYSPLSGSIKEINNALLDDPGAVNRDPYATGWILKLNNIPNDYSHLLSPSIYKELIK